MPCDVAAAATLHYAVLVRSGATTPLMRSAATAAAPRSALSREPLFASIVAAAHSLEVGADGLRHAEAAPHEHWRADEWAGFKARAARLSAMDMQAHLELVRRGAGGDLARILRGLSRDLPTTIVAVDAAPDAQARKAALDRTYALLRNNVEAIATPRAQTSADVMRKG